MLLIRRAEHGDRDALVALVRARAEWGRDAGVSRWAGLMGSADRIVGRIDDPDHAVWVIAGPEGPLGTTTVAATPPLAWTEQERSESAVFLHSTVTHPSALGRGIGVVVAFWALDHAARTDRACVRRGVFTEPGGGGLPLIRYYRRQGWRVVRTARHPQEQDTTVWSLSRPAAPQPDLADVVREV